MLLKSKDGTNITNTASKQYDFVSESFVQIRQEMTSVYFWKIHGIT